MAEYDVIVVGAGNAAFCAALAAREQGASVLVLEAAPEDESGGNSRFTAGSMRVVYNGVDDIKTLVPDLTEEEIETDFGTYTAEKFFDDMARVTQDRANPDLVELLVTRSFDTLNWMRDKGVRFIPIYGRQAFKIDGKFKFWGGLTLDAVGGGPGLVNMLTAAAKKHGIEIRYQTRALDLHLRRRSRRGRARAARRAGERDCAARSVVLASGGFEANPEWRTRYLGPGWDLAKVRGTRFNTGDGIRMALEIGASPCGNWSGCHAVGGRGTRRNSATSRSATSSRSTPIRSRSWSTPPASASSTKAPTSATTPMRNTAASSWSSRASSPGRSSTRRSSICSATNTSIRQITKVTANTIEELAGKLEGVECRAVRQDRRRI